MLRPTHIFLEITRRCNLNCDYCNRRFLSEEMKNASLSIEQIKEILNKFPDIEELNIIGSGEPLCHPNFIEFLDEINKKQLTFVMTTNGVLLNEEVIRKLPPTSEIYFSLDNIDQRVGDPRKENVSLVMNNIRKLHSIRKDVKITLQPVFIKGNLDRIKEYLKFTLDNNAAISFIFPYCYNKEMYEKFYPSEEEKEILWGMIKDFDNGLRYNDRFTPVPKKALCPDPFKTLFIGVTGDIWVCCHMYSARPNIDDKIPCFTEYWDGKEYKVPSYQYRIGNIFKDEPNKIFNDSRLMIIRGRMVVTTDKDFKNRDEYDFETDPYSYCDVCLWRWGCVG